MERIEMLASPPFKLSFCIPTYNRADFLLATIENILSQSTDLCEIVISDSASTDSTEQVVLDQIRHCDQVRYVRHATNIGYDLNLNQAVDLAQGEYCWLMSDDDMLAPGAVTVVLEALRGSFSLVILNAEHRNRDMSKVLKNRALDFDSDRVYGPDEMDRLLLETRPIIGSLACFVIRRDIWLARDNSRYRDSYWSHIGVAFQRPLPSDTLVIAQPLIRRRFGNTHCLEVMEAQFEMITINLPSVLHSLPLSDAVKDQICRTVMWSNPVTLLRLRALGWYSTRDYRRWMRPRLHSIRDKLLPALIALLPGVAVNTLFVLYYSLPGANREAAWLQYLSTSRFHWRKSKWLQSMRLTAL